MEELTQYSDFARIRSLTPTLGVEEEPGYIR
jgi:hypothetical protein